MVSVGADARGLGIAAYVGVMDSRVARGHLDAATADSALAAAERSDGERVAIDGPQQRGEVDLAVVLDGIAARLDVLLASTSSTSIDGFGDGSMDSTASDRGEAAARAWSTVVGRRSSNTVENLRRHALSTTVLKTLTSMDPGTAGMAKKGPSRGSVDPGQGGISGARPASGVRTAPVGEAPGHHALGENTTALPPAIASSFRRRGGEDRLRSVRRRFAQRRVDAGRGRQRRSVALWRGRDACMTARHMTIGLAILGFSTLVTAVIVVVVP